MYGYVSQFVLHHIPCPYVLVLLRYLRRVRYIGNVGRPHRRHERDTEECQSLRLPGVPREEAGRGRHEEVWGVQRGDVLLRRPPKAALASPQ